jgi:hypothetical protein
MCSRLGVLVLAVLGLVGCERPAIPAPAPSTAPSVDPAPLTPGREFDAEAELRRLRSSGAALDDAWTAHARTTFDRWRAAAPPALAASARFDRVECFHEGCVVRMRFASAATADTMTGDFFRSDANASSDDTVFRTAASVVGTDTVVTWGTVRPR